MARLCISCHFRPSSTLITAVTSLLCLIALANSSPATTRQGANEERCIDFELNKIDAITSLANGSLFLVSNGHYWVLKTNEIPNLNTARPISRLITTSSSVSSSGLANESSKAVEPAIEAAVNVQVKAENGACVPTNQILLYSWSASNRSVVTVYENDVLYSTSNLSHVDIFQSTKSVDWSRKIDGLAFWQNMTIIFQGNSFISIRCVNGDWVEVVHKGIAEVFPGVSHSNLDSVIIRSSSPDQFDMATVFMFFGHEFYECSVTGNDPCEGPYNLMSEFFNVDHFCPDSTLGRAETSKRFLTAIIIVIVILFSVCVVALVLYFTLKPEHFTYFVNGKMRSNYNRDNLSYEALKLQNEGAPAASGGVEVKSVTNGKSS